MIMKRTPVCKHCGRSEAAHLEMNNPRLCVEGYHMSLFECGRGGFEPEGELSPDQVNLGGVVPPVQGIQAST